MYFFQMPEKTHISFNHHCSESFPWDLLKLLTSLRLILELSLVTIQSASILQSLSRCSLGYNIWLRDTLNGQVPITPIITNFHHFSCFTFCTLLFCLASIDMYTMLSRIKPNPKYIRSYVVLLDCPPDWWSCHVRNCQYTTHIYYNIKIHYLKINF